MAGIKQGDVLDGYRFLGGSPGDPRSWESTRIARGTVDSGFVYMGGDPADRNNWEEAGGTARRVVGDTAISAVKSLIGVPETVVGLADLATGGYAGKAAESLGFRPKEAKAALDDMLTPEQRLANRNVQEAEGFIGTAKAALRNPSTIFHTAVESSASLIPAGVAARGALALAPRMGGALAAGIGEGVVSAGQTAEQVRQETADGLLTGQQSALAAASGGLTGVIGAVAGKIANRLGIGDIDQLVAGVQQAGPKAQKSFARALLEGFATEGVLQELPQSAQEQIAQNVALNRPWDEGVSKAAATGALAGGLMGAGAAPFGNASKRLADAKTVPEMIQAANEIAFPTGDELAALVPQPPKQELKAELGATPPPVAPPEGSIEFEPPVPLPERLAGDLQLAPQQSIPWQPAPPVPATTADAIANADAVVPPVERAPRQRVEPVEMQPVQPAAPADPVLGFVDQMRQVNTPQARAFVQDFNAGRITRRDVIRVMQSQGQDPLSPEQRLADAAAQAPVPAAGGLEVPTVYRSRTKATVEANKVGGKVVPVEGGFTVEEVSGGEPDAAGSGGRGAVDVGAGRGAGRVVPVGGLRDAAAAPASGDEQRLASRNDGPGSDGALNAIRDRLDAGKPLGVKMEGDGRVTVGASMDANAHVQLELTKAERKALTRAQSELELASTQEERAAARQAEQDAIRPAVDRVLGAGAASVDTAAHEAATSPTNDLSEPTQAQKEAGNYKVGRIRVAGLDISIENPQGSTRSGVDPDGKPWSNEMQSHYGYIRGSEGKDGDHVDVFVKPGTPSDFEGSAFVVDQVDPRNGKHDEHKVMLGYANESEARDAYMANYAEGWKGLRAITPMGMDEFKAWVRDPVRTKRPLVRSRGQTAPESTSPAPSPPPAARVIARVGRTPNTAQAVELRPNEDGTVTPHMEGEAMLDFDTGEPITLPADVTDDAAKQAIKAAGALSSKQNFYAPSEPAPKASRSADPERQALQWERTAKNSEGPEFYLDGLELIAIRQLDTADEFAEAALPLGHASHVKEGNTAHKFIIADGAGNVTGEASLEINQVGKIDAIHDIEITDKRAGVGRRVVGAILANADGPVRIIDILDQSEPFWRKMGIGYKDTYGNATTDWESYRAAQGADARGVQGARSAPDRELEAERAPAGKYEGSEGSRRQAGSRSEPAADGRTGGVEPKARRGAGQGGMSLGTAQKLAAAYEASGLNRVNVARNISELPEKLRKKLSGYGDDVRGAYFPAEDQVWVFSDKVPDAEALHFVVMHEAFHRGLGALMGEQAQRVMRQMYATNKRLRDRADSVAKELKISRDEAIEEALADMAGEGDVSNLRGWARLSQLIKDWLAKIGEAVGIKREFTDKDVETFVSAMTRAGASRDPVARGEADGFAPSPKASRPTLTLPQNVPRTEEAANAKSGWNLGKSTRLDDLVYELQDKLVDTKQAMAAIRQTLGDIRSEFDPYLQEELYHGRAAKQTADFLDKEVKPLLRAVKESGVNLDELEKYLHARHAEERNEQIAKVNPSMSDGGSGMKTGEARRYLAGLPSEQRKTLERLAAQVDAITNGTRSHLVATGLETQESVDAWGSAYKHYVPLQRTDFDDSGSMRGTGAGFSVRGSASKRAMGSDREVGNILANVVMQRERAITRGEKNRVAQAVYGLAIKAPNESFWKAVDPDANDRTPAQLKALEEELVGLGLDPGDAESVFKEPKQRYVDPKSGLVSYRINPVIRSANNVLAVRVNGADRYVFFSDRDERAMRMVSALKNLDAPEMGAVMGLAAKITRYFSAFNTSYNPVFGIINLMRDVPSALLNQSTTEIAGKEKDVARHVPAALKGIMLALRARRAGVESDSSWAKLFDEYERAGGRTGYRDMYETAKERGEQLRKEVERVGENKGISSFRAMFDLLADYNDTMENAVRLSAYKVAREQGMAPDKAASLAKNITVNFNRKGHLTTQIGALYGFFNASAQGTARLAETMKGPRGKKIVAGGLLLGAVQAMLLASAGFADDQPPEFVRERNFIIPTGDGKYVAIPMPLGLHVLPNLTRVPIEWALGGYKDTAKKIGGMFGLLLDTFNPIGSGTVMQTLAPTILDPIAALAENKDFSGRAIAKQDFGLNETPGFSRAKDTATPWAKGLAYAFNWVTGGTDFRPGGFSPTPDQIDYLIGQAFGGVGREASKVAQTGMAVATGETADLPSYKIPLAGRLYGDTKEPAAIASTYYDHLREMRLHAQEVKGRREHGETVADYLEANPEARYAKMILESEKKIAALRKARKLMKEQGIDDEKLQVFDKRITAAMQAVNDRLAALKQTASASAS